MSKANHSSADERTVNGQKYIFNYRTGQWEKVLRQIVCVSRAQMQKRVSTRGSKRQ